MGLASRSVRSGSPAGVSESAGGESFLEPMFGHIKAAGLGTASEIFDGDPPFTPNGCIAQAWTVGEILQAWREIATASEKQKNDAQMYS